MGITNNIPPSRLIQPGVIDNTAARPVSPFEGQCIFQKDTDQLLVWNGTAWVIPNSPAQNPDGLELISTYTVGTGVTIFDIGTMNSTYDNYRLVWSNLAPSTNGQDMYMTFVTSGGTESSSGYLTQAVYVTNANVFGASYASRTNLVCASSSTIAHKFSGIVDLFAPALADYTYMACTSYLNRNDIVGFGFNGRQESATAYSTIRIRFNTGSVSGGTMSLYGYRK